MSIVANNQRFSGTFFRKYVAAFALLFLILFNCLFTQNFISWVTFSNLSVQASKVVLLGLGMTLIIATGGIDISVGSAMGLGATISAIFLANGAPAGIIISLLVVAAFGAFSGVLVSKFSILPLVSTLALMYIFRGLAQGLSGHGTVTYNSPGLTTFFITPLFGHIPIHFVIILIAAAIMYLVVNRMKFGFQVEAYGNNPTAARICGINTTKIIIICYTVSGIFAWASGMLDMIMVSSADPSTVGLDMEVNAIAAAVIGGTPITGGSPNVIGTVCGAILLQLITMMCNMNNVPYSTALIIKACIIVLALFFHGFRKK